jgi:hypothetical protein
MTARFRDFGSGDNVVKAPLSFNLYNETFNCKPEVQGRFLLNLVVESGSEDIIAQTKIITNFFENVLLPESWERFDALMNDPEKIVNVETLAKITEWLMEAYSERPEEQPEDSSAGQ